MTDSRGTSLAELLLVVSLAGLLGALLAPVVIGSSRLAWRTRAALVEERDATALMAVTLVDLRSARASRTHLGSPTDLLYDRPVGEGPVCWHDGNSVVVPHAAWSGVRTPEGSRDVGHLLQEPATGQWSSLPITLVGAGRCPDGGEGLQLYLAVGSLPPRWLRVAEPMQMSLYSAADTTWLGLVGVLGVGTIQPFAGPVSASELYFSADRSSLEVRMSSSGLSFPTWRLQLEPGP